MNGKIVKSGHISMEGAKEFSDSIARRIGEYQSEGLIVEVQYQPLLQFNGLALFTAVILGRKAAE